jgi:hypothetical protein
MIMTAETEKGLRTAPWLQEEMYRVDGRYWPFVRNGHTGRDEIVLFGMWTADESAPMGVRNMMRPIPVADLRARGHIIESPKIERRRFA